MPVGRGYRNLRLRTWKTSFDEYHPQPGLLRGLRTAIDELQQTRHPPSSSDPGVDIEHRLDLLGGEISRSRQGVQTLERRPPWPVAGQIERRARNRGCGDPAEVGDLVFEQLLAAHNDSGRRLVPVHVQFDWDISVYPGSTVQCRCRDAAHHAPALRPQPRRDDAIVEVGRAAVRRPHARQHPSVMRRDLMPGDPAGREGISSEEYIHAVDAAKCGHGAVSAIHIPHRKRAPADKVQVAVCQAALSALSAARLPSRSAGPGNRGCRRR